MTEDELDDMRDLEKAKQILKSHGIHMVIQWPDMAYPPEFMMYYKGDYICETIIEKETPFET